METSCISDQLPLPCDMQIADQENKHLEPVYKTCMPSAMSPVAVASNIQSSVQVLRQILAGLAYIHSQGIIHR